MTLNDQIQGAINEAAAVIGNFKQHGNMHGCVKMNIVLDVLKTCQNALALTGELVEQSKSGTTTRIEDIDADSVSAYLKELGGQSAPLEQSAQSAIETLRSMIHMGEGVGIINFLERHISRLTAERDGFEKQKKMANVALAEAEKKIEKLKADLVSEVMQNRLWKEENRELRICIESAAKDLAAEKQAHEQTRGDRQILAVDALNELASRPEWRDKPLWKTQLEAWALTPRMTGGL